MPIKRWPN